MIHGTVAHMYDMKMYIDKMYMDMYLLQLIPVVIVHVPVHGRIIRLVLTSNDMHHKL